MDKFFKARRSRKPAAVRACVFWWCGKAAYGKSDYCVGHLRNQQRKGHPLASRDAQALYAYVNNVMYPLLRKLVQNSAYVTPDGRVRCIHCQSIIDGPEAYHKDDCPVELAREELCKM